MEERSEANQTKHDRKVLDRAKALREQGFNVRAEQAKVLSGPAIAKYWSGARI